MENSRTSNSIKNIVASVGYQIVNIVLSFVSRTVFINVLGVGYLGINGLFNDVLSMLNMADLGFSTAMTFSMYKPLAEKDYDTLAGLTCFYKKVYRIIALLIAGIGVALIPLLPYLVNLQQEIDHLVLYYLLFLASNVASYLVTYKTTVLYADQKNYILLKYTAIWSIMQTATLTVVLYVTHNYIVFLVMQVLFVYSMNFHKSYVAQKRYPFINKKVKLPKEKKSAIFKDVGSAFLYKISNVMLTATDNSLISVIIGTEMVGYYSNYQIIILKLSNIVSTLFSSLIASLGNLIVKEDSEHRYAIFKIMQSVSAILSSFCVTCLFLLEEDFIRVWLGPQFTLGMFTLTAIVFNFYFTISVMPVTTFREAAGLFRKTKYIMVCTAVLNIVFSIILGKLIGLAGILFATSLSKILTYFWYEPKLLFKDFFMRSSWSYYANLLKGAGVTLLSIGLGFAASCWIVPESWPMLILKGIIVAVSSVAMLTVFYRKDEGFKMIVSKAVYIVKKITKKYE